MWLTIKKFNICQKEDFFRKTLIITCTMNFNNIMFREHFFNGILYTCLYAFIDNFCEELNKKRLQCWNQPAICFVNVLKTTVLYEWMNTNHQRSSRTTGVARWKIVYSFGVTDWKKCAITKTVAWAWTR